MRVQIATDGSGGSKGPGGWAAVLRVGESCREISGNTPEATNNTMEITAAIMALRELKRPCEVELTTDSEYLLNGGKYSLPNWKRYGWKTQTGDPVKNRTLWEKLDAELSRHKVAWCWTKGHAGHPDNERADALAGEARRLLVPEKPKKKSAPKLKIENLDEQELRAAISSLPAASIERLRSALGEAVGI